METGHVSKEVVKVCIKVPGSKFDFVAKRWVFPITSLQILQVMLYSVIHDANLALNCCFLLVL